MCFLQFFGISELSILHFVSFTIIWRKYVEIGIFSYPHRIFVGIRDFQAKSGWLDSLVVFKTKSRSTLNYIFIVAKFHHYSCNSDKTYPNLQRLIALLKDKISLRLSRWRKFLKKVGTCNYNTVDSNLFYFYYLFINITQCKCIFHTCQIKDIGKNLSIIVYLLIYLSAFTV